jgi:hypothetical protein
MNLPPASLRGGHSKDEDTGGGLILHGDKVAWFCLGASECLNLSERDTDILITASYLHDMTKATRIGYKKVIFNFEGTIKRGYEIRPNMEIDHLHALYSAREGCKIVKEAIEHEDLEKLYHIIERHMIWYNEGVERPPLPETNLEKLFSLADYIMSRKEVNMNWEL